jgi:excisionase family DNA binding protein
MTGQMGLVAHLNLTPDEVASHLGISRRGVYYLIKHGRLPGSFKLGREKKSHWRIPAAALRALESAGAAGDVAGEVTP